MKVTETAGRRSEMNIVPNVPLSSFFCVCGPHAMEVEVDVGSYLTSLRSRNPVVSIANKSNRWHY
jgi:hypothetical protein